MDFNELGGQSVSETKAKKRKFRVTRRFYAVVLGTVLVFVGITFWHQEVELNRLRSKQTDLQNQQADNELEKDKLTHVLEAANTDDTSKALRGKSLDGSRMGKLGLYWTAFPKNNRDITKELK